MRWLGLGAVLLAAGCGPTPAAEYGEELFRDAALSESQYNSFSCATCHATTATPPAGKVYVGLSLHNVASRPHWFGGYETRLLDAVNFCYTAFMRGVTPLTPEDPKSRALYEYLVSISPEAQAPAQPFTLVKNISDVPRGSASEGERVYEAACQDCHGEPHTGKGRLTELASILPEVANDYGTIFPGVPAGLVFIEKVRHGRFFGVGGNMPPYSQEALSDQELGALLEFLDL
ncbi:thiosulfate dehydrogenase [Archangium gephyra]|uniref:Lipoprotein n=1 Tax=Archangium gephyra TaxID=48 RepID=A0AAC8QIA6_9BACT|nr:c-type cytochrome [Archangium gephyra]AKJ08212.1 putative lipoprotein [Archangium gephyra]REG15327.1 thiosulfate dehydrogenase [Archangium gephyra]